MPIQTIKRVDTMTDAYRNNVIMGKSNHSYELNPKIIEKFTSNSWAGRRCFIIGGGESLKGFDFSQLDNELTIGINKVFQHYPKAKMTYCMDSTFYREMMRGDFNPTEGQTLQSLWNAYMGVRIFLTPMELFEFGKEVYVVRRNMDICINREDLDKGIYGGSNSGTGAIGIAVALGANPIYLLGYDMKAITSTHWHGGYEKRNIADFNTKLGTYRDDISKLVPLLKTFNINIINLNRNSDLTCFPFDDFDTVIKDKQCPLIKTCL